MRHNLVAHMVHSQLVASAVIGRIRFIGARQTRRPSSASVGPAQNSMHASALLVDREEQVQVGPVVFDTPWSNRVRTVNTTRRTRIGIVLTR
jgi:hypothetical protein